MFFPQCNHLNPNMDFLIPVWCMFVDYNLSQKPQLHPSWRSPVWTCTEVPALARRRSTCCVTKCRKVPHAYFSHHSLTVERRTASVGWETEGETCNNCPHPDSNQGCCSYVATKQPCTQKIKQYVFCWYMWENEAWSVRWEVGQCFNLYKLRCWNVIIVLFYQTTMSTHSTVTGKQAIHRCYTCSVRMRTINRMSAGFSKLKLNFFRHRTEFKDVNTQIYCSHFCHSSPLLRKSNK